MPLLPLLLILSAAPRISAQPTRSHHPWVGVRVDAGVPEGAGASVVLRPLPWLRANVGVLTNGFAPGVRIGVTFSPLHAFVSPTLDVEVGRLWDGNANGLARKILGASFSSGFLDRVGYDFGQAQIGLEVGSPDAYRIFLRAGYARILATSESFSAGIRDSGDPTLQATGPLHARLTFPSAQLGFLLYFG